MPAAIWRIDPGAASPRRGARKNQSQPEALKGRRLPDETALSDRGVWSRSTKERCYGEVDYAEATERQGSARCHRNEMLRAGNDNGSRIDRKPMVFEAG